jgi:hypothetical protein
MKLNVIAKMRIVRRVMQTVVLSVPLGIHLEMKMNVMRPARLLTAKKINAVQVGHLVMNANPDGKQTLMTMNVTVASMSVMSAPRLPVRSAAKDTLWMGANAQKLQRVRALSPTAKLANRAVPTNATSAIQAGKLSWVIADAPSLTARLALPLDVASAPRDIP